VLDLVVLLKFEEFPELVPLRTVFELLEFVVVREPEELLELPLEELLLLFRFEELDEELLELLFVRLELLLLFELEKLLLLELELLPEPPNMFPLEPPPEPPLELPPGENWASAATPAQRRATVKQTAKNTFFI